MQYLFNEYDIQNVIISREEIILEVMCNDEKMKRYSLPIDAYDFIKDLNVFDDVCIKRNTLTEELLVEWSNKGLHIPLSDFSEEEHS